MYPSEIFHPKLRTDRVIYNQSAIELMKESIALEILLFSHHLVTELGAIPKGARIPVIKANFNNHRCEMNIFAYKLNFFARRDHRIYGSFI